MRMTYDGRRLGEPEPVLTGIPNGFIHDGGRLLFDADGTLFVSTGETGEPELAQDRDSLGGKILHITPDGDPAPDNPVTGSPVWTMGHRNVQGLAFDDDGQLWATEFGANTWDELNRIEKGRNYGWPVVEGAGRRGGYRNPFVSGAPSEASPSGLAYLDGSLWVGAAARRAAVAGAGDRRRRGRARRTGSSATTAGSAPSRVAPDGNLWVTTSNRDGRGNPASPATTGSCRSAPNPRTA